MDNDELNGIMECEFKKVKESGILDFGIEIKLKNENDYKIWETESKKISIELVTTYEEKNKENKNETNINLGECEYELKQAYGIIFFTIY